MTHEQKTQTENSFSLAPLGERGDRKAVDEGVSTKMNALGTPRWPPLGNHKGCPHEDWASAELAELFDS